MNLNIYSYAYQFLYNLKTNVVHKINMNNEPIKFKLTKFNVMDDTVLLKMNLHSKPRYAITTMTQILLSLPCLNYCVPCGRTILCHSSLFELKQN